MLSFLRFLKLYLAGVQSLKKDDYALVVPEASPDVEEEIELPQTRDDVYRIFGNPGAQKVDQKWERQNMIVARNLPGSWNNGKGRLYCHKLAEHFIRKALKLAEERGCLDEIERLGCWNFRHQRHDPKRPLSYHSWGICLDVNPKKNRGMYRSRYEIDAPFTGNWERVYPEGVSRKLVQCFKDAGFFWGGDWKSYCDPMHFSLVNG